MTFTLLFVFLTVAGLATGRMFYMMSSKRQAIWVGIQGNADMGQPENGGFFMYPGDFRNVEVPEGWGGRIWPRTDCVSLPSGVGVHCATGDCGYKLECDGTGPSPPATMLEITLNGPGGLDVYNISLLNGFNLPMWVNPTPLIGSEYWCTGAGCAVDLIPECPDDLKYWDCWNEVACMSSCLAYKTDEYCCRGAFNNPDICKSSPSAVYFKSKCPEAYSYPYDDGTSTFTCRDTDYIVQFF